MEDKQENTPILPLPDAEAIQQNGRAVIHIWHRNLIGEGPKREVGHISVELQHPEGRTAYVSAWPPPEGQSGTFFYDSYEQESTDKGRADDDINIDNLDIGSIEREFHEVKEQATFSLCCGSGFFKSQNTINCAGLVMQLLAKGGVYAAFDDNGAEGTLEAKATWERARGFVDEKQKKKTYRKYLCWSFAISLAVITGLISGTAFKALKDGVPSHKIGDKIGNMFSEGGWIGGAILVIIGICLLLNARNNFRDITTLAAITPHDAGIAIQHLRGVQITRQNGVSISSGVTEAKTYQSQI